MPLPISEKMKKNTTKFLKTINSDPLVENRTMRVRNIIVNDRMLKRFHEKEAE